MVLKKCYSSGCNNNFESSNNRKYCDNHKKPNGKSVVECTKTKHTVIDSFILSIQNQVKDLMKELNFEINQEDLIANFNLKLFSFVNDFEDKGENFKTDLKKNNIDDNEYVNVVTAEPLSHNPKPQHPTHQNEVLNNLQLNVKSIDDECTRVCFEGVLEYFNAMIESSSSSNKTQRVQETNTKYKENNTFKPIGRNNKNHHKNYKPGNNRHFESNRIKKTGRYDFYDQSKFYREPDVHLENDFYQNPRSYQQHEFYRQHNSNHHQPSDFYIPQDFYAEPNHDSYRRNHGFLDHESNWKQQHPIYNQPLPWDSQQPFLGMHHHTVDRPYHREQRHSQRASQPFLWE